MEFSVPIFLFVLLLGIVQLAVGVIFGRCLPVHGERRRRERNGLDASHFSQIARRVYQVIANISRDVDEHRSQVARMNDDLAAASCDDPARLAEFVVESVSHLMDLNANLQSRLSAAEDKLREQTRQIESHVAEARTDPLTRLPNRRAFDDELARRLRAWQRHGKHFYVAMIDLDHFKKLNDHHGHLAGDHVLRRIGAVLRSALSEEAMVARVGGEEFAVLLGDRPLSEVRQLIEAVRRAVAAEELVFDNTRVRPTISAGLAMVRDGDDPASLLGRADEALYAAKGAGRNRAFYHNGTQCEPITVPDATDAKWQQICDQLRDRLAQLVESP